MCRGGLCKAPGGVTPPGLICFVPKASSEIGTFSHITKQSLLCPLGLRDPKPEKLGGYKMSREPRHQSLDAGVVLEKRGSPLPPDPHSCTVQPAILLKNGNWADSRGGNSALGGGKAAGVTDAFAVAACRPVGPERVRDMICSGRRLSSRWSPACILALDGLGRGQESVITCGLLPGVPRPVA